MQSLINARQLLDQHLPDFDSQLAELEFDQREGTQSPVLKLFKQAGGPGLLIPVAYGGCGLSAAQAVQAQFALGARSPSLAIASTMHLFSTASIIAMLRQGGGVEGIMLEAIAKNNLLLASGFAEGRSNQSILKPLINAERKGKKIILNGAKKPCSLAYSMDLLSASVSLPGKTADQLYAVLVPADFDGIQIEPFWTLPVLKASESESVVLNQVAISENLLFPIGSQAALDQVQLCGLVWFELLITAAYLGVCAGLVEAVSDAIHSKTDLATELEHALNQLEQLANSLDQDATQDLLVSVLETRYAIQTCILRTSQQALEMLGGMRFLTQWEPGARYLTCAALMFHPPSRHAGQTAIRQMEQSQQPLTL